MEQRLIDGNKTIEYMEEHHEMFSSNYNRLNFKDLLRLQPTIDPVHAAGGCYCRECICRENRDEHIFCKNQKCLDYRNDNDFCSYGERKAI